MPLREQPRIDTLNSGSTADAPDLDSTQSNLANESQTADIFMATVERLKIRRAAEKAAAEEAAGTEDAGTTASTQPARPKRSRDHQSRADGRKRRRHVSPLPLNFGELPSWLKDKPAVGGVLIDPSHVPHLAWHRGITWCWSCGTFALEVPNKLRKECKAATTAGARQLTRLRLGQTPRNEFSWASDAGPPELHREKEESHH